MLRYYGFGLMFALFLLVSPHTGNAEDSVLPENVSADPVAQAESILDASSTSVASIIDQINAADAKKNDVTQPEEQPEKEAILSLFESRKVETPGVFSFMAYAVQQAVALGIPANTIFLILLTPLLATIVSFVRVVVGLPTLEMLVPITLSFAFVAVGVSVGLIILGAILCAAFVSNVLLSRVKIMFYPKRSLSMLFLAFFVFAALTIALMLGFDRILSLSIFPVLILMLIGDSIASVQIHKSGSETFLITGTTLAVGLLGFAMASSVSIQNLLILYPECILLVIPMNLMIGRYFGLRFLEYFRFNTVSD